MLIDLHNHLLWGCDDGPANPAESLEMLRAAGQTGIAAVVCTPHRFHPAFPFPDRTLIETRIEQLRDQTDIHLLAGAEHLFCPELMEELEHGSLDESCLQGRYLLLEIGSLLRPAALPAFLQRARQAGLGIILAHPERTPFASDDVFLEELGGQGCTFLVNAGSLVGRDGPAPRRASRRLLEKGFVHFIASDAHTVEDLRVHFPKGYRWVCDHYGEPAAFLLFSLNPWLVIHRKPPHPFAHRSEVPHLVARYLKEPL